MRKNENCRGKRSKKEKITKQRQLGTFKVKEKDAENANPENAS